MEKHEIVLALKAKTGAFRKDMTAVSASLYAAGGAASRMGTVARGAMTSVGAAMTATAISAKLMSKLIIESSKLFVEYNDTLARTGAILGTNAAGMKDLADEIREVGRTTRFTATQVGEAANALAIAGVTADEMITDKALQNLVKFAIAGGVDIQTATNIGIAGVKAFGMEMDQLAFVSDVLTRTFTRSNVDMVTLGEGLKFVAPVAHSAGISIEETASAIGALGNAGLRGTVAGTGLRMAINKLLKPSFDSQRAIADLGLSVQVLSPRGEEAKRTLQKVTRQMDATKVQTSALSSEIRMLNGELSELSIEQQTNTLAIERIRQKASKSNRDLTSSELEMIDRLEDSNNTLRLSEMTLDLQRAKTQHSLTQQTFMEKELNAQSKDLIKTVEQQAVGITSFGDVLDQLASSGATTTQILEIFGVRGGTAMASLLSQRASFHELVVETENASGATKEFMESIQMSAAAGGSAKETFFLLFSAIQDAMLDIGEPFILMLSEMALLFKEDIANGLKENKELFKELAFSVMGALKVIIPLVVDMLPDMLMALKAMVPIVTILVLAFRVLMFVLEPILQVLAGVGEILQGIVMMIGGDFKEGAKMVGLGIKDVAVGGAKTAIMVATGGAGKVVGGVAATAAKSLGGKALAGGAARAAGTSTTTKLAAGGAIIGADQARQHFADGGFVNQPTSALIGEAGPEVVIPLGASKANERNQLAQQAGLTGGGSTVNIGDIVINGGSNLSTHEVRQILQTALPQAIKQAMLRGTSRVI